MKEIYKKIRWTYPPDSRYFVFTFGCDAAYVVCETV